MASPSRERVNRGLAEMLKGGVIMDVMNSEQAKMAERAGACAVMALEQIPADIRTSNGVARMSCPKMIEDIMGAVSIPVMAKCRIGHFAEAQILEVVKVDFIDESEVLSLADDEHHIAKKNFRTPFVCGARDLGEALRRLDEGASMIRTKGEAGTGNIVEAVRHIRRVQEDIHKLKNAHPDTIKLFATNNRIPLTLLQQTLKQAKLPVVNFAAGGIATPADAALCMQLGVDGVFVGSGIFKSADPFETGRAIVQAVTHYARPEVLLEVSRNLPPPMKGINDFKTLSERWATKESTKEPIKTTW